MSHAEATTFTYEISDEMLARFATSTLAQRIQWLDEMRTFSWEMASPETRERWRRAREVGRWRGDVVVAWQEYHQGGSFMAKAILLPRLLEP